MNDYQKQQEQYEYDARQKRGREEYDTWRSNIMAQYDSGGSGGGSGCGGIILGFIILATIVWLSSLLG